MQVPEWIGRAAVSGSIASVTSTVALAACGSRDCASALAPVNAVSHWIWGERALRQDDASWAYTATGYGIHHAMSVLWALACVYGAFALGLALWRWSESRSRDAARNRVHHSKKRDTPRGARPSRAVSGPGSPTLPRSSMAQVSRSSSTPGR